MPLIPVRRILIISALLAISFATAKAAEPPVVRSKQSGTWSDKETWEIGRAPMSGDVVVIRAGHHVTYDVNEPRETIRVVQIAGELEFARDRNTVLDAGLITITASEEPTEEGFDCHAVMEEISEGKSRPALFIGRPGAPHPAQFTAVIRLRYLEGMDKVSCPALVCCGGRMELHGTPMPRTWVKLKRGVEPGATTLALAESVEGWKEGDNIIVTSTHRQRDRQGADFLAGAETELRTIAAGGERNGGRGRGEGGNRGNGAFRPASSGRDFTGGYAISLDRPLTYAHFADDEHQAEVANLTRNVVIESADPDGVRGHTMYHRGSAGSISYAEFRHLGKRDELGRYSIHFHLCGDTMRGSSVIGASIWNSHNRWITIHGTDSLVVRDCVGFKSVGHGYFLEDGTEVNNILDHNLAALVLPGKTQRDQVAPFDLNRGAGFWWSNCQNQITRNVAVECAEYGYRFDCKKTDTYDPIRPIRQPDGTVKDQDTRILPFVRFEDNEAHTMKFFCMNLRGVTRPVGGGLDFPNQNQTLAREAAEAMPEPGKPFWIRDFKCWEANWSLHLGTTGVFVDGLDTFRSDVAIWRSIMDRSGFRRLTSKEMRVNDIHNPLSMGFPDENEYTNDNATEGPTPRRANRMGGVSSFRDEMPPVTIITSAVRDGNLVQVRGSVADTSDIKRVTVNDRPARSTRGAFAEWEVFLDIPAAQPVSLIAMSEDIVGHVEQTPHRVRLEASSISSLPDDSKPVAVPNAVGQSR